MGGRGRSKNLGSIKGPEIMTWASEAKSHSGAPNFVNYILIKPGKNAF